MLALTDSAVEAVREIVASSHDVTEAGGLRLSAERAGEDGASLKLRIVPLPAEDDEVVEQEGARVFVEAQTASLLTDKVLDASVERDQVAFVLLDR